MLVVCVSQGTQNAEPSIKGPAIIIKVAGVGEGVEEKMGALSFLVDHGRLERSKKGCGVFFNKT